MTDYRNFNVEDFLADALFRSWVLDEDPHAEAFWQYWLADHPDRSEIVQDARALLLAMASTKETLSAEALDGIVADTLGKLGSEPQAAAAGRRLYLVLARVAAAVLLVAGLAWLVQKLPSDLSLRTSSAKAMARAVTERSNTTSKPMTVLLGDKSTVILQPGSKLSYSPQMEKEPQRVVHLDGEAFFDIVKDPAHPFFVYTDKFVTRVLGTSFRVIAYDGEKQASVSVVTGRVSVFRKSEGAETAPEGTLPGKEEVVLSPNEQATFGRAGLAKSRVEGMAHMYHPPRFAFDETPVEEVFDAMEKAYGIDIQYQPGQLQGQLLTATFTEMSLHDELHLICRIIKGNYRIEDGRVIIETDP